MAIRLRIVNGKLIAICAARSIPKEGDVYIDDVQHGALGDKFSRDYHEMYGYDLPSRDMNLELVEQEESNNANRTWWDRFYANQFGDLKEFEYDGEWIYYVEKEGNKSKFLRCETLEQAKKLAIDYKVRIWQIGRLLEDND